MKYRFLVILFFLIIVGNFIGDWNQYKLRGTGLILKGAGSDHQYIVESDTGNIIVDQHVIDIKKHGDFVFVLRVKSLSYECGQDRVIFTHYKDDLEVSVINFKGSSVNAYLKEEFLDWLEEEGIKVSFEFYNNYSNDEKFKKINSEYGCTMIK